MGGDNVREYSFPSYNISSFAESTAKIIANIQDTAYNNLIFLAHPSCVHPLKIDASFNNLAISFKWQESSQVLLIT